MLMGAGLIAALLLGGANASDGTKPLQIGVAKSFITDQSKGIVEVAADDFKEVMKKTTGLDGEVHFKDDAMNVARKLHDKQLDFGIFHAHELAWAQKKYPDLVPVLIAANKSREDRAYVIVHKNSPAKTIADLRGKKLDIPAGTKEQCRLFLQRYCAGKDPKGLTGFFGSIEKSKTQEAALDDVCRDKVQAVVIDSAGLEFYKEIKEPVFVKNLRILQQSEPFPPAAIVCKRGALDEATLKQFRDGLLKANTINAGRELMRTWKIEAFALPPKDYAKSLADVLKAYPPPVLK